jgi:hypothetical protein
MTRSDYDSPWKEVMDHQLVRVLDLLFDDVRADLDWQHDFESLEQELRKMAPEAATGERLADKLSKAHTVEGDDRYRHVGKAIGKACSRGWRWLAS